MKHQESTPDPQGWIDYIESGGLDLSHANLQGINLLDFDLRKANLDWAILHNHPPSSISGYGFPGITDPGIRVEEVCPKLPDKQIKIWKIGKWEKIMN